jgi:hypothetical protein
VALAFGPEPGRPVNKTDNSQPVLGGATLYTAVMPEEPLARATDALSEWIVEETEAEISETLDGLGPTELEFLAGAILVKGEERPRNDKQLGRYLRASERLLDRAIAAGFGR